jgi:hypothetical protein
VLRSGVGSPEALAASRLIDSQIGMLLQRLREMGLGDKTDFDIAVRGLPPARFVTAASKATDALGRPVDFIELEDLSPALRYGLGSGELIRVL